MVRNTIFVHLGQCGNQVGETFWGTAVDKYQGNARKYKVHAVLDPSMP